MYPGSYTDLEIRDCKHSAVAISSGPYPYPYLHLHTTVEVPARQRDITRLYLLYVEDKRPDWPRPRLYPDGESPVIGRTRAPGEELAEAELVGPDDTCVDVPSFHLPPPRYPRERVSLLNTLFRPRLVVSRGRTRKRLDARYEVDPVTSQYATTA